MRTTADLNRIIDKIAENNPARFDASSPSRAKTSQAADQEATASPVVNATSSSFAPRLADASDPLATQPTRAVSPHGRKRSQTSSLQRFASSSPLEERVKTGKNVKTSTVDAEKRVAEETDDENKRTQRRRQIDPTTCERDYSTDEIEFMKALDDYKRASGRMFPTCSEILEVFKSLGYVKIARAGSSDDAPQQNAKPSRAATPAFLSDEENDAFEFNVASVPGVA